MLTPWIHSFLFRVLDAGLFSFFMVFIFAPPMIAWLKRTQIGQVVREKGPESHYSKAGTPTMGGILILLAITLSVLCFGDWANPFLFLGLVTLWLFGGIGFWDDYKKLILKNSKGLSASRKYILQTIFAALIALWLYRYFAASSNGTAIFIPFSLNRSVELGVGLAVLAYFTLTGASNAVNLTDGLDGLAIISIMLVALGLGIIALWRGDSLTPTLSMPDAKELALLSAAIIGAGLGFLWFNTYPAQVFMGDVGALGLGALLGFMAVCLQMELILIIMGGIFVFETLSVILQVGSYRLRHKKRIFKMAPLHHHFELSGWPEPRVMMRFSIVTVLLVMIGLLSVFI